MRARELFEGVVNNKIPVLDIINTIEHLGDEGNGVTKEKLELLLSDFSWYLQNFVDKVLKKKKTDEELLEAYNDEENERFRNAYIIQEYYEYADLTENQMLSILKFIGILHSNIERIEYLNSDKAKMGEIIGDSYKKGMPNSFFTEVHEGNLSDSKIYSKIQEMTDNFDETKLNLLCNDFDFYLFMVREYSTNYSTEEIDKKIEEYHEAGKKIPMLSDRNFSPSQVSEFFEYTGNQMIKAPKEKTAEQKARLEKEMKEWEEDKKNILDIEKLFDPHGIEFFTLYKLRNLLVDLKREHTSAVYKFDDNEPEPQSVNDDFINWLKPESLSRFVDALKDQNLIENREETEIIEQHFKPQTEPQKEPEPIKWLESISLLAYMIEQLAKRKYEYIKPKNIWSDTAPHFHVKGKTPENLRQTANRFKQNKTRKPRECKSNSV